MVLSGRPDSEGAWVGPINRFNSVGRRAMPEYRQRKAHFCTPEGLYFTLLSLTIKDTCSRQPESSIYEKKRKETGKQHPWWLERALMRPSQQASELTVFPANVAKSSQYYFGVLTVTDFIQWLQCQTRDEEKRIIGEEK